MSELFHQRAFKQAIEEQGTRQPNFLSPKTGHLSMPSQMLNLQESSVARSKKEGALSLLSDGEETSGLYSALKTLNPRVIEDPPHKTFVSEPGTQQQPFFTSFEQTGDKENSRPNDELEHKITDLRGRINEIKSSITQELNQSQDTNEHPAAPPLPTDIDSPSHFQMKIDQIKQNLLLESNISDVPQASFNNQAKAPPTHPPREESISSPTLVSFPPLPAPSHFQELESLERENQDLRTKLLRIEKTEEILEQKYEAIERDRLEDREMYQKTIGMLHQEVKILGKSIERTSRQHLLAEAIPEEYESMPRSAKHSDNKVRKSLPKLKSICRSHSSSPLPRPSAKQGSVKHALPISSSRKSGVRVPSGGANRCKTSLRSERQRGNKGMAARVKQMMSHKNRGPQSQQSKDYSSEPGSATPSSVTQREEEVKDLQYRHQRDQEQVEGLRMKVAMLKNVNSKLQRNFMGSIVDIRNSLEQFQRDVLGRQDEIRQEYEAQVGELVSRFKKERRMDKQRAKRAEMENARLREKLKQIEVIFTEK